MSIQRLRAGLREQDKDLKQLIEDVDACFGTGGYLRNNAGSYLDNESFVRTEGVNLNRLHEFISCFGDIEVSPPPESITLGSLNNEDSVLALCALESSTLPCNTVSPVMLKACHIITKMSLFYARTPQTEIPACLRPDSS
jgi:hypothetical protein